MSHFQIVCLAFIASLVLCELVLRGTKLQTGLSKVIVVHFFCWLGTLIYFVWKGGPGIVAVTIFWAGAFLIWFGARSHIESSILLRMLYLLRKKADTPEALLSRYHSQYGEALRVEELVRGGLVARSGDRFEVTSKGQRILRIVDALK